MNEPLPPPEPKPTAAECLVEFNRNVGNLLQQFRDDTGLMVEAIHVQFQVQPGKVKLINGKEQKISPDVVHQRAHGRVCLNPIPND